MSAQQPPAQAADDQLDPDLLTPEERAAIDDGAPDEAERLALQRLANDADGDDPDDADGDDDPDDNTAADVAADVAAAPPASPAPPPACASSR